MTENVRPHCPRKDTEITVNLTVENTGKYDGAEVIQLYAGKENSCFTRPLKELKAFTKVFVKKGEKAIAEMKFDIKELAYFNPSLDEWIVEPGDYTFYIGSSSRDIRLKKTLLLPIKRLILLK